MRHRHRTPALALLLLALLAASAGAQTTHFSLGAGYQWLDVSGNEDMYKSQLNERQGLALQELSLTVAAPSGGLFDRLRVDASGFGAEPEGRFRLSVGRSGMYDLRISYFRARAFSALPTLANPFLDQGIVPGQHTQNRVLDNLDMDLQLFPGAVITPLVGYSRYHVDGPGTTTYHVGENEYRLDSHLAETTHEARAGVGIHLDGFQATVVEAWRAFHDTDAYALAPGGGAGNNPAPVLGQDQSLDSFNRRDRSDGSYAVTTGSFAGTVSDRLRFTGSFVKTDFQSSLAEDEQLSGSLVSFAIARFFGGLGQQTHARTSAPDWRGAARVEAEPVDGLEASGGYARSHRDFDGLALISSLYTGTVNYAGLDPRNLATLLTSTTALERNQTTWDGMLSTRNLGPLRLWADVARVDEELTVTPDAAEIVVPGGQGGRFDRTIRRWSAGATATVDGLKLALDWKDDHAPDSIVRTDYRDLKRWRLRADWTAGKLLRVVGTAEKLDGDNPAEGIDYDFRARHWGVDVDLTALEALGVRLGYAKFKADSAVTIVVPQNFTLEPSLYTEDGEEKSASASYKIGPVSLEGGWSRFTNSGDLGLSLDRAFAHCDVELTAALGATLVFDRYRYRDDLLAISNFDANRYAFLLRWHE